MAINRNNPILKGISGKIGKRKVVIKHYKYGEVISNYPDMSRIKPSAGQKEQRSTLRMASIAAKRYVANPSIISVKIKKGKYLSLYHAAVAYFLKERAANKK